MRHASSLALLLFLPLPGCNFHAFYGDTGVLLAPHDQPWAGPAQKAGMSARLRWDFVKSHEEVTWQGIKGYQVDAFDLAYRCDKFVPREFQFDDPDVAEQQRNNPGVNARRGAESYPDTRTIVSIDPPIVVILPIASGTPAAYGGIDAHGPYAFFKLAWGSVTLPRGYQFGSRLAYHPEVRWYLATDQAVIRDAEFIDDNTRRLDYGLGALILTREDDHWIVKQETDPGASTRRAAAEW